MALLPAYMGSDMLDEECRMRAMLCVELAVAARTPQLKAKFVELSMQWEKLATIKEDLQWWLDDRKRLSKSR